MHTSMYFAFGPVWHVFLVGLEGGREDMTSDFSSSYLRHGDIMTTPANGVNEMTILQTEKTTEELFKISFQSC